MKRLPEIVLILALTALLPAQLQAKKFVDQLPARSQAPITGFSYNDVVSRLSQLPRHHIEGVWQYTDTDIQIAIVRQGLYQTAGSDRAPHYLMIVVTAPNRCIMPGTVMGHISHGGSEGVYTARIYTQSVGRYLTMPKSFTINLDDSENSFSLRKHNSPLEIFLWRFAPYLWRYPITPEYQNITRRGCLRLYPEPTPPLEPVYL